MVKNPLTTLCYIERDGCYLMLHRVKKEKDVNRDKWIGIGGHFEEGESPEECLLREAREETGLTLLHPAFRGIVTFTCEGYGTEYMHLFTCTDFLGSLTDCDEGVLEWVRKEDVAKLPIWEGDQIFFSLLNSGRPFFSLKLAYVGDTLISAALDGEPLDIKKVVF